MSAFPDIFLRGNNKKKYVDVADRACRQNFADIVGCWRHAQLSEVGDRLKVDAVEVGDRYVRM